MGYFDLPTGEFELLLKKKGRGRFKEEWTSVMFTDRLNDESIADCVERWSENYKVMAARFNGRKVFIPHEYHWELVSKGDVLGEYSKRSDAKKAWDDRRMFNWGKPKEERIPVGVITFVED